MPQYTPGYYYLMITIPCIISYWLTNTASALLFGWGIKISARGLILEWQGFFEALQITSLALIIASLKLWGHQMPAFPSYLWLYKWQVKTQSYPDIYLHKDTIALNCSLCIYIASIGYTAEENSTLWRGFCSPATNCALHSEWFWVLWMVTLWRDLCSHRELLPPCPHTS